MPNAVTRSVAWLSRRFTYANVVATLALFLALAGTSWAAAQITGQNIKNNSVTGVDIRNGSIKRADLGKNSVDSRSVRNGSLQARDLSKSARKSLRGARGAAGPAGATGATGPVGPAGAAGVDGGLTGTVPAGETMLGEAYIQMSGSLITNGRKLFSTTDTADVKFDLPVLTPVGLDPDKVFVVGGADDPGTGACAGSAAAPTAPGGYLCVYPHTLSCLESTMAANGNPKLEAAPGLTVNRTGGLQKLTSRSEMVLHVEFEDASPSCNNTLNPSTIRLAWFNWAYTAPNT